MSEQSWQSILSAIIFHPIEAKILLLPEKEGYILPSFRFENHVDGRDVRPFLRAMQLQLGIDVTVLYYAFAHVDENEHIVNGMYTLEITDHTQVPTKGLWCGQEALVNIKLAQPEQQLVIERCLIEIEEHAVPKLRPPWARRGWFQSAALWIQNGLTHLSYTIAAPIEQTRTWGLSCMLRVQTTRGNVYFKVSPFPSADTNEGRLPLLFANEAAVTQALATFYPDSIPTPITIDRERGWMLLEEFGPILDEQPILRRCGEALSVFGRMQVASATRVEALRAAGCLDRSLARLVTQIDPLLNDVEVQSRLDTRELEQLRIYAPQLKDICMQLASYALPQTLVHGDIHPNNIAIQRGNYLFFDWTDACISHPFLDLAILQQETHVAMTDVTDAWESLLSSYLAEWTAYEPMERLREAYALAEPLGALHQAISYQHIVANMEGVSRNWLIGGLTFWLRVLLRCMISSTSHTTY